MTDPLPGLTKGHDAESLRQYAVYKLFDGLLGLVDFCGLVYATEQEGAEMIARLRYPCDYADGERLDVVLDDIDADTPEPSARPPAASDEGGRESADHDEWDGSEFDDDDPGQNGG